MHFELLQKRLVEQLRARVRNGDLTERSLARLTGVSQPHVHNVLKGSRFLSTSMADQVLRQLRIGLFDLLKPEDWPAAPPLPAPRGRAIAILAGRLGPGEPFPLDCIWERLPVLDPEFGHTEEPALARLGSDLRMSPLFQGGELVLLERAESQRRLPAPDAYYAVALRGEGLIRRLRRSGERLHLIALADGNTDTILAPDRNILEVVKAKVIWIGRSLEPPRIAQGPIEPAG